MIQVLLLDIDGVLIQKHSLFSDYAINRFHLKPEPVKEFFNTKFNTSIILGQSDLRKELHLELKKWGWKDSIDDFLHIWFSTDSNLDVRLIKQVKHLRRHNITCAVASNLEPYRLEYLRTTLGFASNFDYIFSSCELGVAKPNSAFYQHIANTLAPLQRNQVLFWDDSSQNVRAAGRFGFHAHQYQDYSEFLQVTKNTYQLPLN